MDEELREKIEKRLESYNIRYNRKKIASEIIDWDMKPLGYCQVIGEPPVLNEKELVEFNDKWEEAYEYVDMTDAQWELLRWQLIAQAQVDKIKKWLNGD